MTQPMRGSCLCGGVRFLAKGDIKRVSACYCGQCTQQNGGSPFHGVELKGELVVENERYLVWYASSEKAQRGFCRRCGSSLFWKANDDPSFFDVSLGTLDDIGSLSLDAHIFVDSCPSYLTVPINPELADSPTNTSLGAIGIAITGAPIFNDQEGPMDSLNEGVISGFDNYGAHTGPQVYHYHLEPTPITNDDFELFAILRDGFFLYGRRDWPSNEHPTDLDESGGHVGLTQYSPDTPVYHYHIKNQIYSTVNGKDAYLLFDEAYQGTPNAITN